MQLQSNLSTLLEFDLNQLLAVQSDVTLLISRRVHELLNDCREIGYDSKIEDKTCNQAHRNTENMGDGSSNRKLDREEYDDDSEAFILTQLDQKTREKIGTHENDDTVALRSVLPRADISSPLKESQSLPDSYDGTNLDSRASFMEQFEQHKLPSANNNNTSIKDEDHYHCTKKMCINKSISISPRTNFNINPLTGKAWILEDFKRNENINYVKKAPIKIQEFVKNVSLGAGTKCMMNGAVAENDHDELYEFENLRDRCHSPPGFGRLDFPNTQERFDDKQKSQNLIFLKTKLRFRKATCNTMPPYEREFLFKSNKLNEIVDDGNFEWSDSELQIYMRK